MPIAFQLRPSNDAKKRMKGTALYLKECLIESLVLLRIKWIVHINPTFLKNFQLKFHIKCMEGKLLFLLTMIASLLSSIEVKFLESKKVNEVNN